MSVRAYAYLIVNPLKMLTPTAQKPISITAAISAALTRTRCTPTRQADSAASLDAPSGEDATVGVSRPLTVQPRVEIARRIEDLFRARGRVMAANNLRQAR